MIEDLRLHSWKGPENFTSPIHWIFNFTIPMLNILRVGSVAQPTLLRHLNDADIKDQIIILLGGVGDVRSIKPLIDAMADSQEQKTNRVAKRTNLAANLALTNITAAEVIWHRGGGITFDNCPKDPKSCWLAWWELNKDNIEEATAVNRNYTNYPNYGIYRVGVNH